MTRVRVASVATGASTRTSRAPVAAVAVAVSSAEAAVVAAVPTASSSRLTGGGGGGSSLATTIVEGVNSGNGSLTITFAAPAAQAVTVTPKFTG